MFFNKKKNLLESRQIEQSKIVQNEIEYEENKLKEKYVSELAVISEESLKIKNQIVTIKKKKENFYMQTETLKEINKEQVILWDQGNRTFNWEIQRVCH